MASAAARLLFLCGFRVVVLERAWPLAVRRRVCFAEAVLQGRCVVDGVAGRRVEPGEVLAALAAGDGVPVVVDPDGLSLATLAPAVLVDARMAKRNLGTRRGQAPLVIGLGPGFDAGGDVHAVVETARGSELGRVIRKGAAAPDTGQPAPVMGHDDRRVLRAPRAGIFRGRARIGDQVAAGHVVGEVAAAPVACEIAGLLRGLIADGVAVERGMKVGDVDPRGAAIDPALVSDKGRAVAAGVLEAVMLFGPPEARNRLP